MKLNIVIIPRYEKELADGELFEYTEYRPMKEVYGVDRPAYHRVKSIFNKNGHNVYTSDQIPLSNADVVLIIDPNPPFDSLIELADLDPTPYLVYLMREPPSVIKFNNSIGLVKLSTVFDSILTWHTSLVETNNSIYQYHLPWNLCNELGLNRDTEIGFEDQDLLVNISSNKNSNHPNEIYSERRQIIEYYEKNHPNVFSLYGKGWNSEYDISYGTISDKTEPYQAHRFALCFENTTGIDGYITEKIFDCFRNSIVPVYWGANDISKYVPRDTFIDYRNYGTPRELHKQLINIDEDEYNQMKTIGKQFAYNDTLFTPQRYADQLLDIVSQLAQEGRTGDVSVQDVKLMEEEMRRRYNRAWADNLAFDEKKRTTRVKIMLKKAISDPSKIIMNPVKLLRWGYRVLK